MLNMVEWITDRLPEEDGFYLITTKSGKVRQNRFWKRYGLFDNGSNMTAWANLPEPYKGEDCIQTGSSGK